VSAQLDSAPADAAPAVVEPSQPWRASRTAVLTRAPLLIMLVMQAAWTSWLCGRGWFYQDDLSALHDASVGHLGWGFLTRPVNDHLVPGYRLVFWIQLHTSPLSYTQTIVARVALQTLAVYLLFRLLVLLVGDRRGVLVITALYAANPLIVCNLTWLTTAACLIPAELAAIVALDQHVRYTTTRRLRHALGSGTALLIGMCFWEKTAIIGLFLPVLSLGYLSEGSPRKRIRALLARWPGWIATIVPPMLFVAYFLGNHYGGSAHRLAVGDLVHAIRTSWLRMAAPALFGGPWSWFDAGTAYVSWSSPTTAVVILSQIGFLALVVVGWLRTGARSLWAWCIPALSVAVGTGMVAVGRYFAFGDLVSVTMRYSFDFALALALGVALALIPTSPAAVAIRAGSGDAPQYAAPDRQRVPRVHRRSMATAALTVAGGVLLASVVSSWRFQQRWEQNPTKPYVDTLTRNIARAGPSVNLYDTAVSSKVTPYFFGPTLHLSDLLGWAHVKVRFDQTNSDPLLVDQDGRLQQAHIIPSALGIQPRDSMCEILAQGIGSWRTRLTDQIPAGEGFLRLEYFQQRPSTLHVLVETASGALVAPVGGSRTAFPVTLGALLFRTDAPSIVAVVVKSRSAATNVCIGNIVIGAPFAPAK
jgi:hypothetical protein